MRLRGADPPAMRCRVLSSVFRRQLVLSLSRAGAAKLRALSLSSCYADAAFALGWKWLSRLFLRGGGLRAVFAGAEPS